MFIPAKKYLVNEMENIRNLKIQNELTASQEKFGKCWICMSLSLVLMASIAVGSS